MNRAQMLRILSNYDVLSLSSEDEGIEALLALNVSAIKHEKVSQVLQKAVRGADVCLAKSDLTSAGGLLLFQVFIIPSQR